jgi:hypothetical protein
MRDSAPGYCSIGSMIFNTSAIDRGGAAARKPPLHIANWTVQVRCRT